MDKLGTAWRRSVLVTALVLCAFASLPNTTSAAMLNYTLAGNAEFSKSGASFTGNILIEFKDTAANTVTLTIDATGVTAPTSAYMSNLWFNINAASGINPASVTAGSFTVLVGTVATPSLSGGNNFSNADGGGLYDFKLDFANGPPASRLAAGEKVSINLSAAGLDALDFNALSSPQGGNGVYFVAAHIQSLGTGGQQSGFFGDSGNTPVPEPSTIALAVSGFVGFGLAGMRRFRRRVTA